MENEVKILQKWAESHLDLHPVTIEHLRQVKREYKSHMRTNILATIDELNQYLNGNVTSEGAKEALLGLVDEFPN